MIIPGFSHALYGRGGCFVYALLLFSRVLFTKRLLSGSHSSHSNLSQASVTSDPLGADDLDTSLNAQHAKIAERRSNSSNDIQGGCIY